MANIPSMQNKGSTQNSTSPGFDGLPSLFTVLVSILDNQLPNLMVSSQHQLLVYFHNDVCQLRESLEILNFENKTKMSLINVRYVCSRVHFIFKELVERVNSFSGEILEIAFLMAGRDILSQLLEGALPNVKIIANTESFIQSELRNRFDNNNTFEAIYQLGKCQLLQAMELSIPRMESSIETQFLENLSHHVPSELIEIPLKMETKEWTTSHFIQYLLQNPTLHLNLLKQLVKIEVIDPEGKQDYCEAADFQNPQFIRENFRSVLSRIVECQAASFQITDISLKLRDLIQDTFNTVRCQRSQRRLKQESKEIEAILNENQANLKQDSKQEEKELNQELNVLFLSNSSLQSSVSQSENYSQIKVIESKRSYAQFNEKVQFEQDAQFKEESWLNWPELRSESKETKLQGQLALLRKYKVWRVNTVKNCYDWSLLKLFEYPSFTTREETHQQTLLSAIEDYVQQRVIQKNKASLYIETLNFTASDSLQNNGLYCLEYAPSNLKRSLYFMSVEVSKDSKDVLRFEFNKIRPNAVIIIYFNPEQNTYFYQYNHRLLTSTTAKERDRAKGYYKPTNFLTCSKPLKWSPKVKFMTNSERSHQMITLKKKGRGSKLSIRLTMKKSSSLKQQS